MRAGARPSYPRVSCLVPGCGRGSTRMKPLGKDRISIEHPDRPGLEYLCAVHWRRVPKRLKVRHSKLLRWWRKTRPEPYEGFWTLPPGSPERLRLIQLERLIPQSWDRMVAIAKGEEEPRAEGLPEGLGEELRRLAL